MAYKDPTSPAAIESARASRRKHYHANKEQYKKRNKEKIQRLRELIRETKSVPCMDCKQSYPSYVMDFDHRDPSIKEAVVGELVRRQSLTRLKAEMAKCDVVCANCHRIRTHSNNLSTSGVSTE